MLKFVELFFEYFYKKGIEPCLNRLDLWNKGFITFLVTTAYVQWAIFWEAKWSFESWPPGTFSSTEQLLWGSLLAVVALGWISARKSIDLFRRSTKARKTLASMGLLIVFSAVAVYWSYSAYKVYRIYPFPLERPGFFIARLNGDRQDETQNRLVSYVERKLRSEVGIIEVSKLPKWPSSHQQAREFGKIGRASLVVWGQVQYQDHKEPRAQLNVTPVYVKALAEAHEVERTGYGMDIIDRSHVNRLLVDSTSEDFLTALAMFLEGYQQYFSAEYGKAFEFMYRAKEKLQSLRIDERSLTPENNLLATVNFYLANTYIGCASSQTSLAEGHCTVTTKEKSIEKACELYRIAVETFASPGKKPRYSCYVEALNNLAFLVNQGACDLTSFQDYNPTRPPRDYAHSYWERADNLCRGLEEIPFQPDYMACAHVAYNFGFLMQDERNFAEAYPLLNEAISRYNLAEHAHAIVYDQPEYWFFSKPHQALAYNYAKAGETEEDKTRRIDMFKESELSLSQAITIMEKHSIQVPIELGIAKARIHIGRSQWEDAVKNLELARSPKTEEEPDFHLLWSIAEECRGRENWSIAEECRGREKWSIAEECRGRENSREHLIKFYKLSDNDPEGTRAGREYFRREELRCNPLIKGGGGR